MASRLRGKRLWKEPIIVWLGLLFLLAVSIGSAYLPFGGIDITANLTLAAIMVVVLVAYLMDLRHGNTLIQIFALAGVFWSVSLFALIFADYLTRHY
jgi:caa(3)-type oxidase subunit IV